MALLTINGIPCEIYVGEDGQAGGVQESWPEEGPKAVVEYTCDWSSRYALMQGLRGGVYGGVAVFPHAYPPSPNLYCKSIGQVRGIKPRPASGFLTYEKAVVPAEYGIPTWNLQASDPAGSHSDPSGKELCRTRFRTSVEVMRPPSGAFYWESGPDATKKIPDSASGLIRVKVEINIQRMWLPRVPLSDMIVYSGTVNQTPVQVGDYTFPKGTLMYMTANAGQTEDSLDGMTFEGEHVLVGCGPTIDGTGTPKYPEWNQIMARDGTWNYVNTESDGSGDRPYRYTEFWDKI
jgi:hypothetical protein